MARIGQEITFGEIQPAKLPNEQPRRSAYVIDLRPRPAAAAIRGRPTTAGGTGLPPIAPALPATFREQLPAPPTRSRGQRARRKAKQPRFHIARRQLLVQFFKAGLVLAGAIGFLWLNIPLAERLIGIYLVAAIVYAIDSQHTFLVALVFLIMVAVWSALGNSVSAQDFASYAFYFLAIGLISAIREMLTGKNQPAGQH